MTNTIAIGSLTLVGGIEGANVHVAVLGDGLPGQRPLCGRIVVTAAEWDSLVRSARVLEHANVVGEHWRNQGGVNVVYLDELEEATRG